MELTICLSGGCRGPKALHSAPVSRHSSLVLLLFLGIGLRLPSFGHRLLSDDESIYAATADALSKGAPLYADVVDHKPPAIYWVYRAGFAVFGEWNTHGAHAFLLLSVLISAWFLLRCAERASRNVHCGFVAALLWLVFSTTWHDYDSLAANCELFLVAFHTAAAFLLLGSASESTSKLIRTHFLIGVLVGFSALFKYQGITWLGVVAAWAFYCSWQRQWSWKLATLLVTVASLGAMVPAVSYFLAAWNEGSSAAALYWFEYNFHYVGNGLSGVDAVSRGLKRLSMIGGVAIVAYGFGLFVPFRNAKRLFENKLPPEESRATVLGVAWLGSQIIGVCAGGRFFGHYFHLVLPPLVLLAAPAVARALEQKNAWRVVVLFAIAFPAMLFLSLNSVARQWVLSVDAPEPPYGVVADRIKANTAASDRIFVWGNSPQIYVHAERSMGSRFSFCNYMTGENPGSIASSDSLSTQHNVWRPSWDMLMSDLEARRPQLLVDAAAGGFDGYKKYPMTAYPRLQLYVDANYSKLEDVEGVVLYKRRP
jgi:hypothetical protein